jgi:hypothetical protein
MTDSLFNIHSPTDLRNGLKFPFSAEARKTYLVAGENLGLGRVALYSSQTVIT